MHNRAIQNTVILHFHRNVTKNKNNMNKIKFKQAEKSFNVFVKQRQNSWDEH